MFELLAVMFFAISMAGNFPCCCKKCDCCRPVRSYIIVDFAGVANDNCAECGDWNTTAWEVPRDVSVFAGQCTFSLFDDLPCGFVELRVNIGCEVEEGPADTGIQVLAFYGDPTPLAEVQFSDSGYGEPPIDCTIEREISFSSEPFGSECDWTSATCTLST